MNRAPLACVTCRCWLGCVGAAVACSQHHISAFCYWKELQHAWGTFHAVYKYKMIITEYCKLIICAAACVYSSQYCSESTLLHQSLLSPSFLLCLADRCPVLVSSVSIFVITHYTHHSELLSLLDYLSLSYSTASRINSTSFVDVDTAPIKSHSSKAIRTHEPHPLYVLVSKILSSILNSPALIHPLSTMGPTCHFI
jgi:hypothetical protein